MFAAFGMGKTGLGWQQRWPQLLVLVLAILLLIQLVRLVWTFAVPAGPLGDWRVSAAQMLSPAERRTLFGSLDPFFRAQGDSAGMATVTALDLSLFGVSMNEASGGGSAIIAGADGVQTSFALGDEVVPGVKLVGVAFDHVLLDRGGARETLFIDQSIPAEIGPLATPAAAPPLSAAAATSAAPSSGELTPAAIQAGIGLAARTEAGKVTGLTVQPQGDGAVFRAAGLRPGDVIRSVNGRPLANAADLAGQIAPGARLSLEVERGGAVVPLALFIGKP